MGVEVDGIEELKFLLRQAGAKGGKSAFRQMKKEAMEIRDLARQMAPVDEGDLESAIVVNEVGGGRDKETGRFMQKAIAIEVDGDQTVGNASTGEARTVGDYAYIMHEYLAPYGRFKLGKRSRAKQAANPGVMVGGKYLERAVAEREQGLIRRIIEAVRDEF